MITEHLTASLNEQQCAAVSAPPGNLLILAGAGSGKTRVLVHRIAWLIEQSFASPHSILAVTFTNKAAHEMRARIESLLRCPMHHFWVGTFHGLAHRLLRLHGQETGLNESFQILDSDDQYRLIRRIQKQLNVDETKWPPKQVQWFINKQKEAGLRPHQVPNQDHSYFIETLLRVYHAYEEMCRRSSLVDFAELLLRSLELLQSNAAIREHYQQRFQHILVDEFQDTNKIQYAWLSTLKIPTSTITAVGDDDQSIYSWRGACIDNIHRFTRDFAPVTTIRLEQNYRSTQTILNAANAVIANNCNRMGKNLWTAGNDGHLILLYPAFNERDEAFYVAESIKQWLSHGNGARDVAILYRSNAQSRILEEQLIDKQIPYRIYGGLRFYERAEIKDAIAYLRLLVNRHDDASFERVINTPPRGIGNTTLGLIRDIARTQQQSLWHSTQNLLAQRSLSARAANALAHFMQFINDLAEDIDAIALGELFATTIEKTGLRSFYQKDKSEKSLSRIENLDELINAAAQFQAEDQNASKLNAFLAHVALESGDEQVEQHIDCVNLMTLHSAKGLEFPLVFITGLEEELFPHKMSLNDPAGLEEERRLLYVGITRAMEKLVLTYAESRRLHGVERYCHPSRFIHEIPEDLIQSERARVKVSRPQTQSRELIDTDLGLQMGQRVHHTKFGTGTIINYEGHGPHTRLQIKFDQTGTKWLVASFANLEIL
ncbi:MAG: DNA helicase II [Gammaproteobacteria bacterium RIFCSPHIGHO2_12_FULL_41_15]|nr:MAG: DNA helicase II [Gammaproteobacteria bacterium RIFCSPHIGHO2_12_FULL_41_15]